MNLPHLQPSLSLSLSRHPSKFFGRLSLLLKRGLIWTAVVSLALLGAVGLILLLTTAVLLDLISIAITGLLSLPSAGDPAARLLSRS